MLQDDVGAAADAQFAAVSEPRLRRRPRAVAPAGSAGPADSAQPGTSARSGASAGTVLAAGSRLRALGPDDRAALGIWAAAHLALLALAWAAAWAFRATREHAPLTAAFEHWDAGLLRNIAEHGYFAPQSIANNAAFFPGYPAALAAGHLILRNWVLSEVVVAGVAGCFAVVALARLAGGSRAVLYLIASPAAIFLMIGYAEGLFLAFAIPAWHAAARGRWWRAALLAGLAGLVRPDALFLIPALALMALVGYRGPGTWPTARGHGREAARQRRHRLLRPGWPGCLRGVPLAAYREPADLVNRTAHGLGPAPVHAVPGGADDLVGGLPARLQREHRV